MYTGTATVRRSYIDLRGLNLGTDFLRETDVTPGQKLGIAIEGLPEVEAEGTINGQGFIGGLAVLYREFELREGDRIGVSYDGTSVVLSPPPDRVRVARGVDTEAAPGVVEYVPVFDRDRLRHVHIERFAPGNLRRWVPQSEPDVYMVFGVLAEKTDYRYCCGVNSQLLQRLGYSTERTKPDAILMDAASGQYMMAEFKMYSKDFSFNHKPEDVDVLVCWIHDEKDLARLPQMVLELKGLLLKALEEGEIEL